LRNVVTGRAVYGSMSKTYRSRLSALNDRVAIQTAVAQLRELARTDTTPALRAARVRDISKNAPSLQGLSHAGVARSRRHRMISAVNPHQTFNNVTTPCWRMLLKNSC
jgi:hypothetical protein